MSSIQLEDFKQKLPTGKTVSVVMEKTKVEPCLDRL